MKAAALLFVTGLVACGSPPRPEPTATPPTAQHVRIDPDGIAGLEGPLPFTLPVIEQAFPGFDVVSAANADQPAFLVRAPGSDETLFSVTPDWTRGYVGGVAAILPAEAGTLEIRAGETLVSALPEAAKRTCTPDRPDHRDGAMTCEVGLHTGMLVLAIPPNRGEAVIGAITFVPEGEQP